MGLSELRAAILSQEWIRNNPGIPRHFEERFVSLKEDMKESTVGETESSCVFR